MFQDWLAFDSQHRFRRLISEFLHPCAFAGGQDNGFHIEGFREGSLTLTKESRAGISRTFSNDHAASPAGGDRRRGTRAPLVIPPAKSYCRVGPTLSINCFICPMTSARAFFCSSLSAGLFDSWSSCCIVVRYWP